MGFILGTLLNKVYGDLTETYEFQRLRKVLQPKEFLWIKSWFMKFVLGTPFTFRVNENQRKLQRQIWRNEIQGRWKKVQNKMFEGKVNEFYIIGPPLTSFVNKEMMQKERNLKNQKRLYNREYQTDVFVCCVFSINLKIPSSKTYFNLCLRNMIF